MTDLNLKKEEQKDTVPAEQAAQAAERVKKVWGGFLKTEKIIAIGALVSFVGFFLPWLGGETIKAMNGATSGFAMADNNNWLYLHPLLMLVSLGLVYFSQGASNIAKALIVRWQIIIGTIFSTIGIIYIIGFQSIIDALGIGGGGFSPFHRDIDIEIGIGWWLLTLGAIAILVGAFITQEKLLKK